MALCLKGRGRKVSFKVAFGQKEMETPGNKGALTKQNGTEESEGTGPQRQKNYVKENCTYCNNKEGSSQLRDHESHPTLHSSL